MAYLTFQRFGTCAAVSILAAGSVGVFDHRSAGGWDAVQAHGHQTNPGGVESIYVQRATSSGTLVIPDDSLFDLLGPVE